MRDGRPAKCDNSVRRFPYQKLCKYGGQVIVALCRDVILPYGVGSFDAYCVMMSCERPYRFFHLLVLNSSFYTNICSEVERRNDWILSYDNNNNNNNNNNYYYNNNYDNIIVTITKKYFCMIF